MILSWFRRRRRRKILERPFPADWLQYLQTNVVQYRSLSAGEQAKLRDDLRIFIDEKHWEGCAGLVMTDEIKVTIAGLACLMVLGLDSDCYDRVQSILVYPRGYVARDYARHVGGGVVLEETTDRLGEAHYRGPVILSWEDVLADSRQPHGGKNLVFHEFAHQLDMLDGLVDGTPPLRSAKQRLKWRKVMTAEYERLVAESDRGRATLLDQYGATDEGEFFAVATECFFNRPRAMLHRHPRLYEVLRDYYRQDPAARKARSTEQGMET
jgi:Mlc titration factor MtfA (ptsG expression regulator)